MSDEARIPVTFSGNSREYFGIWIVNILLSLATLGIYSAWAKVRTKKYFHQHTSIAGRRFDYHATGVQILIGRLIVLAAIVAISVLSTAVPPLGGLVWLLLIFLTPWLLNRSMRVNAAMTSWSNVRFRFRGQYWRAFRVFVLYPFLVLFTFYLAFPFVARASNRYIVNHRSLGQFRFWFESGIGPFYKAFLLAILWGSGSIVVIASLTGLGFLLNPPEAPTGLGSNGELGPWSPAVLQFVPLLVMLVAFLPARFIYSAFVRNAVYGATRLGDRARFQSTVNPLKMVWIALSNAALIVVSIGLLTPWARVRMATYLAANTYVIPQGSFDDLAGQVEQEQTAIGDAYTDFESVDLGVGI